MDIVGWALDLIDLLGGVGIALVLAAENLVAMIPGEILLPFVGMLAERDGYGLAWAIGWTTAGSVAGAYVIYGGGRILGRERATRLLLKVPLTEPKDIDRANDFFERYGGRAVAFVRWIPMLRALISLPAGTHGMGAVKFGLCTAIGSGTWNALFVVAGYYLGQRGSDLVGEIVATYSLALAVIGALVATLLVTLRVRRRRREKAKRAVATVVAEADDMEADEMEPGPTEAAGRETAGRETVTTTPARRPGLLGKPSATVRRPPEGGSVNTS